MPRPPTTSSCNSSPAAPSDAPHHRSGMRYTDTPFFVEQEAVRMQSVIHTATRIVVKVGSSLVTNDGKGLDHAALARWAAEIAELRRRGKQVVLVSSGAIAEGCQRLGWAKRPKAVHELQAAAAVGQMGLCQAYESAFREYGLQTAQVLLTHEDLYDRLRYLT